MSASSFYTLCYVSRRIGSDAVLLCRICTSHAVPHAVYSAPRVHAELQAESIFETLQCELIDRHRFATKAEPRIAVFKFIEGFYNPFRRHSSIGYPSPAEFEVTHRSNRAQMGTAKPETCL